MFVQCIFHQLEVVYHCAHLHVFNLSAVSLWLAASGINGMYEIAEKLCRLSPKNKSLKAGWSSEFSFHLIY